MLVTFAVLILLIVSLVLVALHGWKEDFRFTNLLAGGAAILAWLLLFFSYSQLPIKFTLHQWGLENFFPDPPAFLIDRTSWAFAISQVGFGGAVAISNQKHIRLLPVWTLGLTAAGVLVSFSANTITLLYSWTLIDVLVFLCLLQGTNNRMQLEQIVNSFAVRLVGLVFIVGAGFTAYQQGVPLTFDAIPPSVNIYLILAAVLRLCIWLPSGSLEHIQGFETILRVIPAATSLTLIARIAKVGLPAHLRPIFLYFLIVAALLAGFTWALASIKKTPLQIWIWGMGALSVGVAVFGYPRASLAWGIAALLLGSLPFLASDWSMPMSILGALCFIGFTALPFTPTWAGVKIYSIGGWGVLFGVAHGLLAGGYLRIVLERHKTRSKHGSWEILPSVSGIAILPITQIMVSLFLGELSMSSALEMRWLWGSLIALSVVAGVMVWNHFSVSIPESFTKGISAFGSIPRLIRQALMYFFNFLHRFFYILTEVFEGEGGVMWTLLGALLVVSILASMRGG